MRTMCGFSYTGFNYLLSMYERVYQVFGSRKQQDRYMPCHALGWERILTEQSLGFVLVWARSRTSHAELGILFDITASTCSIYLGFGQVMLSNLLARDPNAVVELPNREEVRNYQILIHTRYPQPPKCLCCC